MAKSEAKSKIADLKQKQADKKSTPKPDPFRDTIEAHLKQRAEQDPLFAETLKKENKNIEDCCTYIFNQVKASGRQGFTDPEIYDMAVHYYDEDDIKPGSKISGKVIVNHAIELTEDDKALAKEKAIEKYANELKDEVKKDLSNTIELTEEEKAEARKMAVSKAIDEEKERLLTKKKTNKKTEPAAETDLFGGALL